MDNNVLSMEEAKKTSIDELLKRLSANTFGLTSSEAEKRLRQFGPNEILEKTQNPLKKFLSYFWGPIPWMIEVAVIMSAALQRWPDFGIVLTLLMVNAVVGFWQERKAGNAIEMLKQRLALTARILRDGKWQEKPAKELVPVDVVRLRLGEIIPADVKLVDGEYLLTDESALTGESLPVEKYLSDIGYASSIVRHGEMNALVINTAERTFFGKTTKLVEEAQTRSHFQKAIIKIGDYLIILAVLLVLVIFAVSIFRGQNILEIIQFSLVLTVAAIPAALPAILSVTMAIGAIALSKKEAIVSKLVAIEEMAGMDILCSDKTGTITKNELTVGSINAYDGFKVSDVLLYSLFASRGEDPDPIDRAIVEKAKGIPDVMKASNDVIITGFKPFDPVSKRTEATIKEKGEEQFKVSKGAPQVILALTQSNQPLIDQVLEDVNSFAMKGYRALGVSRTNNKGRWRFVGLLGLYDPPREDSAKTIKAAQSMGVSVKMVTGDHIAIAKEVAVQVGLGKDIATPSAFR